MRPSRTGTIPGIDRDVARRPTAIRIRSGIEILERPLEHNLDKALTVGETRVNVGLPIN
jgi:hypothetical protein